jgi:hypothetical protein
MPTTISQGLATPAGLVNGSTAQASHVSDLYTALNAFVIPDGTLPVTKLYGLDDLSAVVNAGGASFAWPIVIPALNCGVIFIPFTYTADGTHNIVFELFTNNSTSTGGTYAVGADNTEKSKMLMIFIGPRSAATTHSSLAPIAVFGHVSTLTYPTSCDDGIALIKIGVTAPSGTAAVYFNHIRAYLFGG